MLKTFIIEYVAYKYWGGGGNISRLEPKVWFGRFGTVCYGLKYIMIQSDTV